MMVDGYGLINAAAGFRWSDGLVGVSLVAQPARQAVLRVPDSAAGQFRPLSSGCRAIREPSASRVRMALARNSARLASASGVAGCSRPRHLCMTGARRSRAKPRLPRGRDAARATPIACGDARPTTVCNQRLIRLCSQCTWVERYSQSRRQLPRARPVARMRSCAGRRGSAASSPPPPPAATATAKTFVGSAACDSCHRDVYTRWKETLMANVVVDPASSRRRAGRFLHAESARDLSKEDVAFIYGTKWKQRYFTKRGDDYFVFPAQWDVRAKTWRRYYVEPGTDWWAEHYPADQMQRPTGPLCDGCHSVNYDIKTKTVTEWNVGCEKCHGAGSLHVQFPVASTIVNPSKLQGERADDVCLQCHSQGQPRTKPLEGVYYDWPVGYQPGDRLSDVWMLEEHHLGKETLHALARRSRAQEPDAGKRLRPESDVGQRRALLRMPRCARHAERGDLRLPGNAVCLQCHGPQRQPGPPGTLEQHTQHAANSEGSNASRVTCRSSRGLLAR